MNIKICLCLLISCGCMLAEKSYDITLLKQGWFLSESKILCIDAEEEIGFIYLVELPYSYAVLHSFFVFPHYRNQGIGKDLLHYACMHLKQKGIQKIYVQPGPFDLNGDHFEKIDHEPERPARLKKLLKLYKSAGFEYSTQILSKIAACVYAVIGLGEDAQYLMSRT